MPRLPVYDEYLPDCEGPRLHPFPDRAAAIDFIRLISNNTPISDSGEGPHAHVFEVSIKSQHYALKIFTFYDDRDHRAALYGEEKNRVSIHTQHSHMDPFNNECRAYGKIIDAGLNGKVAVRCYGYLAIQADVEEELRRKYKVQIWNRPDDEYNKPVNRRQPFRAILKDLVTVNPPFTEKVLVKILRDLKRIRKLDVYVMDVEARNYRGGLLVDFSVAVTLPHYLFEIKTPQRVRIYKRQDLIQWQSLVEEFGVKTWARAVRNGAYCKKLRSADSGGGTRKLA